MKNVTVHLYDKHSNHFKKYLPYAYYNENGPLIRISIVDPVNFGIQWRVNANVHNSVSIPVQQLINDITKIKKVVYTLKQYEDAWESL